jgi:hypothetical protein
MRLMYLCRCVKYEQVKKNNQVWTHAEDLELLRGFQLFGSKWSLYHMFFLPHKRKSLMKSRWLTMQKMQPSGDNSGSYEQQSSMAVNNRMSHVAKLNMYPRDGSDTTTTCRRSLLSAGAEIFLNILKTIDRVDPSTGLNQQDKQFTSLIRPYGGHATTYGREDYKHGERATLQWVGGPEALTVEDSFHDEAADEELLEDSDDEDAPKPARPSAPGFIIESDRSNLSVRGINADFYNTEDSGSCLDRRPQKRSSEFSGNRPEKSPRAHANSGPTSIRTVRPPQVPIMDPAPAYMLPSQQALDPLSWLNTPFPAIVPFEHIPVVDLTGGVIPVAPYYPPLPIYPAGPTVRETASMSPPYRSGTNPNTVLPDAACVSSIDGVTDSPSLLPDANFRSSTTFPVQSQLLPPVQPHMASVPLSRPPTILPASTVAQSMPMMSLTGNIDVMDMNQRRVQAEMQNMMMRNSMLMGPSMFGPSPYMGMSSPYVPMGYPLPNQYGFMNPGFFLGGAVPYGAPFVPYTPLSSMGAGMDMQDTVGSYPAAGQSGPSSHKSLLGVPNSRHRI